MPRDDTYDRLNRLDLLASRLKADAPMTIGGLAEEFGVSRRTLSRDISVLRDRGLPIEADSGRGGGIRLHRNWGVGRLALTYQEAIELLFSIAIAERLDAPWMFRKLPSIRHKLAASFSPPMRQRIKELRQRIHVGATASAPVFSSFHPPGTDCMALIFQAFLELRRLIIRYRDVAGNRTDRCIEPHHFLLTNPVWYLYVWDAGKDAVRCLRCDRIESASLDDAMFRERPFQCFENALAETGAAAL